MKSKIIREIAAGLALCVAVLLCSSSIAMAQSETSSIKIEPTNYPDLTRPTSARFGNVQVRAEATESYMLIIPTEINLGKLAAEGGSKSMASASFKLIAKEVFIADGDRLEVTAAGSGAQNAFILSITGHSQDTSVPYKLVNQSSEIKPGKPFCSFESGKPGEDQSFSAQAVQTQTARYAGDYTGTISFTCSIVKP